MRPPDPCRACKGVSYIIVAAADRQPGWRSFAAHAGVALCPCGTYLKWVSKADMTGETACRPDMVPAACLRWLAEDAGAFGVPSSQQARLL